MNHSSELHITTPSEREVVVTRDFDAPRALVFDALTKPELIRRWLLVPDRELVICEIDLRVGGAYRQVWRGEGRKDVGIFGVFREVVAPERLVKTEFWEDWDAGETLDTIVLSEQGKKTRFTSTMLFPSQAVRDTLLKSGLDGSARDGYARLAEVLKNP